jgi:hypothetical protein
MLPIVVAAAAPSQSIEPVPVKETLPIVVASAKSPSVIEPAAAVTFRVMSPTVNAFLIASSPTSSAIVVAPLEVIETLPTVPVAPVVMNSSNPSKPAPALIVTFPTLEVVPSATRNLETANDVPGHRQGYGRYISRY